MDKNEVLDLLERARGLVLSVPPGDFPTLDGILGIAEHVLNEARNEIIRLKNIEKRKG